jgi:hypothetical protein
MAFGKVSSSMKIKNLQVEQADSSLIFEHFDSQAPNYFLFLLDYACKNKKIIDQLKKDIATVGITSYCIVSCVTIGNDDKKLDTTKELLPFESDWRKYIKFCDVECSAIVAFGRAIRVLNRSADIGYYDFIDDKFSKPRYFCGSKFVGGPDKWIYPASPIDYIYPFSMVGKADFVCYHTRFFRKQLTRLIDDDFSLKDLDTREIIIHDCSDESKIDEALNILDNAELLALDTETSGFSPYNDVLGTVQMCADGVNSYYFEWITLQNHKRKFTMVLKHAKRLTLANAKFDICFLYQNGIRNIFATDDTTFLSWAINSARPKGLKPGTWFWCGNYGGYDDMLDTIKKKLKVDNYLQIPKNTLIEYAAMDPAVTWRQQVALDEWCHYLDKTIPNEKIPEWTIYRFYKEIMIPNARVMTMVQLNGSFFSRKNIAEQTKAIDAIIDEERSNLAQIWKVDKNFEFSSTDKLGKLFEKMGWPEIERNKKGVYSTSDPVLQEYERLGMPGIKNLKRFRSFMVARNTFVKGWSSFIVDHDDGTERVHPVMNLFGVVSFRHACNDPNFQQIPSAKEIAHLIKQFFVAPPSHEFIEVEDDKGNKWDNSLYINVITQRGSVRFEDLVETDEILEYDKNFSIYDLDFNTWCY